MGKEDQNLGLLNLDIKIDIDREREKLPSRKTKWERMKRIGCKEFRYSM